MQTERTVSLRVPERVAKRLLRPQTRTACNLGAKDVANEFAISERTARRHMSTGQIPSRQVGKVWRTNQAALDAYVAAGFARAA